VLIITSNDKESRFRDVDNACAMENIYLAASSMGLGCVWINQVKDCYDDVEVRKLLTEFGIPENHGVYGCAAIGYPAGEPREKQITAISKIVE
jgi:nitroreductase